MALKNGTRVQCTFLSVRCRYVFVDCPKQNVCAMQLQLLLDCDMRTLLIQWPQRHSAHFRQISDAHRSDSTPMSANMARYGDWQIKSSLTIYQRNISKSKANIPGSVAEIRAPKNKSSCKLNAELNILATANINSLQSLSVPLLVRTIGIIRQNLPNDETRYCCANEGKHHDAANVTEKMLLNKIYLSSVDHW